MKSFHLAFVHLPFRNTALWKLVAVLPTWSTGLLLRQMRSFETYILNIMSSGGIVFLNLNSGNEKLERDEQLYYMYSRTLFTLGVGFSGSAFFRRF